MHYESNWKSKVPVWLVLLFAANLLLVMAVEALAIYRHPAELSSAILAQVDPVYENCTILSTDSQNFIDFYLVESTDGDLHLVVTQKHPIISGRARIRADEVIDLSQTGEEPMNIKLGISTAQYTVTDQQISIFFLSHQSYRNTGTLYITLAAVLEGLELFIWHKIKRE